MARGQALPRALREQLWSPLNVPLMWAAAGDDGSHPVIEWLAEVAQRVREPLELPGGNIMTEAALRAGWTVLRSAMRSWGIQSTEHLSAWLGRQGFPRVSPGNHISARAQEFLLGEEVSFDARAAWLEAVFVMVTIQTGT